MEWESGSRRGPPSAPRLHGETQAGGELGEEEVVLGGESLPSLAAPQEETPMPQPAQTSGDCASQQHPTPAPLHPGV